MPQFVYDSLENDRKRAEEKARQTTDYLKRLYGGTQGLVNGARDQGTELGWKPPSPAPPPDSFSGQYGPTSYSPTTPVTPPFMPSQAPPPAPPQSARPAGPAPTSARTPSFVDPASYGQEPPTPKPAPTPTWQSASAAPPPLTEPKKFQAPPPYQATALEEPSVPNYSTSEPPPLAAPQMPGWKTVDEAGESTRQAKTIYQKAREEFEKGPPLAQHKQKGFKKVLHTIGDVMLNQDVMHPNVAQQRADWEERMGSLSNAAKAAEKQAEEDRRQAALEAEIELKTGHTAYYKSEQARADAQANEILNPSPYKGPIPVGSSVLNPKTGKYDTPNPSQAKEYRETPAEAKTRREQEADSFNPPLKGRDRTTYVLTGKLDRPRASGTGSKATPAAFRAIENTKNSRMISAKRTAEKAAADVENEKGLYGQPLDAAEKERRKQRVWANYNDEMNVIQQGYEAEIIAAGGEIAQQQQAAPSSTVQPPAAAVKGQPSDAVAPPATKPLDRETAADYLRKANGDKAKAREMAKRDGWTF